MSKKIHVLIKEPGKKPRSVNISHTLENLQKTVGGYIEAVTLTNDFVIICNEEGRLKRLPWCGITMAIPMPPLKKARCIGIYSLVVGVGLQTGRFITALLTHTKFRQIALMK